MEIHRLSLINGARLARGLTVIIDVFRAFTTAAYVFEKGAERIIPVSSKEEAFKLKDKNSDWILMGECRGHKIKGFDLGNSPYEVKNIDFSGCTIVHRTSAGTQGIVNAVCADEILLGSFVMADAIIYYIKSNEPEVLSLVSMGWSGLEKSPEDELFAEYIEMRLNEVEPDFEKMKQLIRNHPEGDKFFDITQPQFIEEDFHAAMDINRFNFCLKVIDRGYPIIIRVEV